MIHYIIRYIKKHFLINEKYDKNNDIKPISLEIYANN